MFVYAFGDQGIERKRLALNHESYILSWANMEFPMCIYFLPKNSFVAIWIIQANVTTKNKKLSGFYFLLVI